jgi:hypothetical protein
MYYSYICHLIKQSYQFVESKVDKKVETYFNIQACQNESLATELREVKANLAELTVRQEEEADGRINEGYIYFAYSASFLLH